ncbi:hypothetical protein BDE02_16G072700 [Populus trichocarpa]|nr:hypothetical protein BDE02_16G072700 [Populus trichocarpa]
MFNAAMDEWPDVVIGHSMGGKVALQFAESCTRGDYGHSVSFPKQLWVLDSVPVEVSLEYSDGEVEKVLRPCKVYPHQSHHEGITFLVSCTNLKPNEEQQERNTKNVHPCLHTLDPLFH